MHQVHSSWCPAGHLPRYLMRDDQGALSSSFPLQFHLVSMTLLRIPLSSKIHLSIKPLLQLFWVILHLIVTLLENALLGFHVSCSPAVLEDLKRELQWSAMNISVIDVETMSALLFHVFPFNLLSYCLVKCSVVVWLTMDRNGRNGQGLMTANTCPREREGTNDLRQHELHYSSEWDGFISRVSGSTISHHLNTYNHWLRWVLHSNQQFTCSKPCNPCNDIGHHRKTVLTEWLFLNKHVFIGSMLKKTFLWHHTTALRP